MYPQALMQFLSSVFLELSNQHELKKLADTPLTNHQFIAHWVTKTLKSKRFSPSLKNDLLRWQKMARSQGKAVNLHQEFIAISQVYEQFFSDDKPIKIITDHKIETFMDQIEDLGFEVVNEFELTQKTQIFTDGPNAFVLCAKQCEENFQQDALISPMSFYVRGDHQGFIEQALKSDFLLHKQSKYKSIVKYYGEYLIYPKNVGNSLAEIPLSYLTNYTIRN